MSKMEVLREKLHEAINKGNLSDVMEISRELDKLIVQHIIAKSDTSIRTA